MPFNPILIVVGIVVLVTVYMIHAIINLRRVVPTNMVHIVQSSKFTTPYGRGKAAGNTYYSWPNWLPVIGVEVLELPESIFNINLQDYEAYDEARLPFMVDVTGFFRLEHPETAAQRVSSFKELQVQLHSVLQGAVRRILATNKLEEIMESRSSLGQQFTDEVTEQIREWGVIPVKTIEFMDLRDNTNSSVIANIMEKEKSRIDKESRIAVASNKQAAELAEIDAQRTVDVQSQDALQQVGLRTAEKDKTVGIANEQANQEIKEQQRITAEKDMTVEAVRREREAEIARNVNVTTAEGQKKATIISAEAEKESIILKAEATLQATTKEAEGNLAVGKSKAESEKLLLLAPVDAQITLAKEIGENASYQQYLITVRKIEAEQAVGIQMAEAVANADLKVISTGGESVTTGVNNLMDMFSAKGGTKLAALLAGLSSTEEGKNLVSKIVE